MINFEPLGARVLVKDIVEKKTGMLEMAPNVKGEPPVNGTVIAIGPDVKTVLIGDIVYYSKWINQNVKLDGEEYRIIPINDILGKVKDGHTDQANTQATPVN
jgi:chaperonin GroES